MGRLHKSTGQTSWQLTDTYDFISTFLTKQPTRTRRNSVLSHRRFNTNCIQLPKIPPLMDRPINRHLKVDRVRMHSYTTLICANVAPGNQQRRQFHDYFVTHLPSSSLHPDSRSSTGPHHKLPRAASTPHTSGSGPAPAAAPPSIGISRDLTVVRIPLKSAKHHFGVSVSRGTRPYNEDTYQAGTIEIPAFAKRTPISLSRRPGPANSRDEKEGATSAASGSGDPQVFFFAVYDGHGGNECSDFLKEDLHEYIEDAAELFELGSSLRNNPMKKPEQEVLAPSQETSETSKGDIPPKRHENVPSIDIQRKEEGNNCFTEHRRQHIAKIALHAQGEAKDSEDPLPQEPAKSKALQLESSLVSQWSDTVGGYFRRFKPEYFDLSAVRKGLKPGSSWKATHATSVAPISIETVLMYAFLRADLDFITAQASKPDPDSSSDLPLNNDEVLGEPSRHLSSPANKGRIGGANRFKGGSTASVALISTPSPTPFWHPASPSTLLIAHVGDTRILLCETSTGLAIPTTTNHHPSSPIEGSRLRRYAATFVTDSFGEERMSGLANTRAFGDMRSKRIGVSAEPELQRYELGPAQYSFLVLVSDGVSGTLSDQEIVDVVKEAKTPEQGAKDVVSFATEVSREGDNSTCLVVRLGGWERRGEGGMGSLGTKEVRDFRRQDATDPRSRRT